MEAPTPVNSCRDVPCGGANHRCPVVDAYPRCLQE
jgi:hypothetical protein